MHIVAFAGSLRERSFNRALLRGAREAAPSGVELEVWDQVVEIPLYNAEMDEEGRRPGAVEEIKGKVAEADALLLAVPEYNWGISGVMKNAIDWISRPAFRSPLAGKPVAMVGASAGAGGTARAQTALRTVLASTLAHVYPHPGVQVGKAKEKFEEGRLADPATRKFLADFLEGFAEYVRRFR